MKVITRTSLPLTGPNLSPPMEFGRVCLLLDVDDTDDLVALFLDRPSLVTDNVGAANVILLCCVATSLNITHSMLLLSPVRRRLCDQSGLSVILSVCRITAKLISRCHWNLVLCLGLPTGRTN